MNIAIVTINQENAAIASWQAAQDFSGCTLAHWKIEPQPAVAEQVLDALVEQWQRTPADVVLFPPGTFGDELSTRLAAFTWCKHLPGDFVRYSNRKRAQIPLGKCANGDAANRKTPAMPFPGASGGSSEKRHVALWYAATEHCPRCASRLAG
ncbi:hypothetical protein ECZU25_38360 [Escherichia coli]|nr:hypothetical protein ECZU25_38360 [Escherichia coli]